MRDRGPLATTVFAVAILAGTVVLLVALPLGGAYYANIGVLTLLSLVLAASLRPLLVGGEASFCHGAFYAIGAYTVAILTTKLGWSPWLALPAAGVVAAVGAALIGVPSLRTTGAEFFVMTFGFMVLTTQVIEYWTALTGGFSGIVGVPSMPGAARPEDQYLIVLAFAVLTTLFFAVTARSRWGLELRALGDNVPLAAAAGIGRRSNLLGAFTLGAFFAGVAGGMFATIISFVSPTSFSFWLSIYVLTYVIVGGARHVLGPVVGTAILGLLPLGLAWSATHVALFTALVTLAILLVMPQGVVVTVLGWSRRVARPSAPIPSARPPEPLERRDPLHVTQRRAPATQPILVVDRISKRFAGTDALTEVSFEVSAGEIVGIIGPNGAGKTTLFNAITGFLRPTAGEVSFRGRRVTGTPAHRLVRTGLVRTFQAASVFPRLTVLDNVLVARTGNTPGLILRTLQPARRDARAVAHAMGALDKVGLTPWAGATADDLPYGVRKSVGVAIALAAEPTLLCLDEPLAGLSEDEAAQMMAAIRGLRDDHDLTVLLIEHRLRVVADVCDRMLALDAGRRVADGTPASVLEDPEIQRVYFGERLVEAAHD